MNLTNNLCSRTPDKFGYYQVGPVRTYSKIEAIEIQQRTGHFPQWNFNDQVFAGCDWTQDPNVDLWELYKIRAQQIRNTYDYVVLLYSGGSDSQNLLGAWLDAGLKIDEIATMWNINAVGHRDTFWNGEVDRVVLPMINEIKKRGYEFKFRLLDISEQTRDIIDFHADDYKYYTNCNASPNNHAKNLWRTEITDYSNIIEQGRSLCFVWGSEKPMLNFDGRLYLEFIDIVDNCVNPYTQSQYHNGWYDELFYWTPDLPLMIIKQAHTIKKFLETVHEPGFYQHKKTSFGYNRKLNMYLTVDALKSIIYPYWHPSTYVDGKSGSFVVSQRDAWLINSSLEQGQEFKGLLSHLLHNVNEYWLNDAGDIARGFRGCVSPKYYLE